MQDDLFTNKRTLTDLTFGECSSGTLGLRLHRITDKDSLVKAANHPEVVKYSYDSFPHPYTEKDAENYFNLLKNQNPRSHFAVTINDELIGGFSLDIGTDVERFSSIITCWIGKEYWGKDVASIIVSRVCDYVFKETKIVRIAARVFDGNKASERVLEKCGFVIEGVACKSICKNGAFLDGHLYARIKSD